MPNSGLTAWNLAGMCTRPFRPRPRQDTRRKCAKPRRWELCPRPRPRCCESETKVRPRRYKLPRRLVKSSKQSPEVAAYRDNWSGIRAKHVAFIIWAFYGRVNAVVVCDTGFCLRQENKPVCFTFQVTFCQKLPKIIKDLPESEERRILSKVWRMDVLVEWRRRYADWYWLKLGDDVMWDWMRARNSRSRIFEMKSRLEMGL